MKLSTKVIIFFAAPLISWLILYIYECSEGDYPYIYNNKNAKYIYSLTYIDDEGAFVISYDSPFYGSIIINETTPKDILQNCLFIVGRYENKNNYFLIDKNTNHVDLNLNKDGLIDILKYRHIDIDLINGTNNLSARKKLYAECDNS